MHPYQPSTMKQPTIFTIGGATFDIFVKAGDQAVITFEKPVSREKWLAFPHGAKVKVQAVQETYGGGASNAAVTFAGMGLDVHFAGMVGEDYGEKVISNLRAKNVGCEYVLKTSKDRTGFSNIINTFDGDRILLYYAGANRFFGAEHLPLKALKKTDWIFLSHVAQEKSKIPHELRSFLKKNPHIKLAWNPGHEQIEEGIDHWKDLLAHTEVLFLNKEEASRFTRTSYTVARDKKDDPRHNNCSDCFLPSYADDSTKALKKLVDAGVKHAVITDGRHGVQASNGMHTYFCPVISRKRVDTVGAGDAYASGFTSALVNGLPLKTALVYGTINAGSVVNHPGAQNGLVDRKQMEKAFEENEIEVTQS